MLSSDIKPGMKVMVASARFGEWQGHPDSVERLTKTQIVTSAGYKFYKDTRGQVGYKNDPWNGGSNIYFEDEPLYPKIIRVLTVKKARQKAYSRMDNVRKEDTPESIDAAIAALEQYRAILSST